MMKYLFYCLLLFTSFSDQVKSSKLPKTWKVCKKSDPEVNECLRGAIENAIHELADGNPSLGVLPIDPLHFDNILIDQKNGPINLRIEYFDLKLMGLKNVKITSVKNDWKVMHVESLIEPALIMDGKYKADGKVLMVPMKGEGHARVSYDNLRLKTEFKFKELEKSGKHFLEVTDLSFIAEPNGAHFQFDNLFNGNKALGDTTNTFLNENWKEILKDLGPVISKAYSAGFKEISNRVFSKIALEEISPP